MGGNEQEVESPLSGVAKIPRVHSVYQLPQQLGKWFCNQEVMGSDFSLQLKIVKWLEIVTWGISFTEIAPVHPLLV